MEKEYNQEVQEIIRWLKHLELDCKIAADEKREADDLHRFYLAQRDVIGDIIDGIEKGKYKNWRLI